MERNKNFFRKIEIFHFLPSFFAEKWRKNAYQLQSHKVKVTTDTPSVGTSTLDIGL
jgi:hypothetical protein